MTSPTRRTCTRGPGTRPWTPYSCGAALPDLHLGQHPEAAPGQQRRQGERPVLHGLAPAEPAGEGQPAGRAHGAAAEARPRGHLRGGRQGALQLPVHLPAEPQGRHVPRQVRAHVSNRSRRWEPCWGRSSASSWGAAPCARASAETLTAAPPRPESTTPPSRPGCNSLGNSRRNGLNRHQRTLRRRSRACPAQQGGSLVGRKRA